MDAIWHTLLTYHDPVLVPHINHAATSLGTIARHDPSIVDAVYTYSLKTHEIIQPIADRVAKILEIISKKL